MPFIIDGGGGTPSPTPTPVPAPIATSQVDVYVDNTSTGVTARTGNIAAPFLTIQEALNKIGKPTSSADSLRLMCIHVSSGNYTETLNVPEGRMIKIVCHGWVNFTGNINYLSDGNARLGSGIRSFLSISGIDNNLATSTHIGRQGGMLINGRIVRKGTSVTGITTHDLYLSNVQVTGGIGWDASIAQPGGTSVYLVRSRLQGTTSDQLNDASTGFPLVFQQVEDSKIEGTLKLSRFGGAVRTEFSSVAMTLLQAGGDIPPYGFFDCVWTGTNSITAPANSLKLNGVSFVNSAAVTLSGGVTRQRIEDFTPLATGATDNAVTRFDGTTGLLQTSGVTIDDTNNVKGAASVQLTGGTGTDGTVSWNDGDGTIDIALKGGQTVLQVGQEQVARVLNNTGAALSDGQVVYITGAQGQRPTVALADADTEATSSATIGILTEPIANWAEGFITLSGLVRNIDTSAWAEGAQLYVSSTAGALTTTKPVPPAHAVRIGWVVRQHATSGSILVHVQNGYELDELHDVLLATPTNRQSLAYETASGLWKNTTLTKSDVGLANVDNTSDANKPVSSATQTALDGKQSVALGLPDIRPSLLLDFANSQTVDPRITFTRASTATRTNARQLIEIVSANTPRIDYDPVTGQCKGLLIEESRTNLLTYSEQFDNAAWVKAGATVAPNATIAPDGTITADKLVEDIANSQHFVSSFCTTSSGAITASVFVKAAGRAAVQVNIYNGTDTVYCRFDINSGTFITSATVNQGTNYSSATSSATNVGNGWYRVSIGVTSSVGSASTSLGVYCYNSTSTYTGNGTSGLYIWGAQLEAGAFPTSYIPSTINFTGRASTGTYIGSDGLIKTAASGEARYQYNPLNLKLAPKLLLEEQRTNLLLYSGDRLNAAWNSIFINGGGKNFWTVTASTEVGTPGDVGTIHKYVATSTPDSLFARQLNTFSAGKSYVASLWLYVPVSAGVTQFTISVNFNDIDYGNSQATSEFGKWVRLSMVVPALAQTRSWVDFELFVNTGASPSAGFTFYATAFQLEEIPVGSGAYPTSYIKTEAAQVTRVADTSTSAQTTRTADVASMTGTNFSSWYRQDEGTVVFNGGTPLNYQSGFQTLWSINDGSLNNVIQPATNAASDVLNLEIKNAGSVVSGFYPAYTSGSTAVTLAYKANDVNYSKDGVVGTTDTSATIPNLSALNLGSNHSGVNVLNGHISRLAYYPKRLANTELQALTS